ncbi:MAG: flagellar hook-basal body complex protein, partial [Desulfovibrio sp.]|nr:flagellar hook-basal body complex protein [Desulfovibrio sp.]
MSLTASMWTSVSGLLAHGEKMNVVGDNIANVNTIAFKSSRMDFQDFVYQTVNAASGPAQVGRGVSINAIFGDFSQGAFETSNEATDIAIAGNGFFRVRPKNSDDAYYTRAGNFTFNKDGYLVDPHGYVLQGWLIDRNAQYDSSAAARTGSGIIGTGSPVDICLDTFTCPPRHTQNITLPVNLRNSTIATEDDKTVDVEDPYFALLKNWDASQDPPLGQDKYAYQSTMEVYDEAGRMHKLTIYFDRVANVDDGSTPPKQHVGDGSHGESYWEYIITMDPTEDVRDFNADWDASGNASTMPNVPDKYKGLLAAGTITFNSSGEMKDMTCFVPQAVPSSAGGDGKWWTTPTYSTNGPVPGTGPAPAPSATQYLAQNNNASGSIYVSLTDPTKISSTPVTGYQELTPGEWILFDVTGTSQIDLSKWIPAPFSSNGFPMIAPNFSGTAGQQMAYYEGNNVVLAGTGQTWDYTSPNKFASERMIAIDFGLKNKDRSWHFPPDSMPIPGTDIGGGTNLAPIYNP